jgi:hypothetical protein
MYVSNSVLDITRSWTYLFSQLAYPRNNALTLIRPVLNKERLCPELEAWVAVFLDDVESGEGD